MTKSLQKIVIVGGGAGGLELATQLGNKLGKRGKAEVILIDRNPTHLWKPLLHEVATGAMDEGIDALSYIAQAHHHHFQFQLGVLDNIDRQNKLVQLATVFDEQGKALVPSRRINYDILVMAIGSTSNDFKTAGVKEHCIYLDNPTQAHRFRNQMLNLFIRHSAQEEKAEPVKIAIVGGGATGVELSAELYNALQQMNSYGFNALSQDALSVTLVEAGVRILPALPERISNSATQALTRLGVRVLTATQVIEATDKGLQTKNGEFIDAELMVWAAGIKAPDFLQNIAGLETNRINQLVVKRTLQTTRDENIYAIGDCASCTLSEGRVVPPRAQSAHQMASCVLANILARFNGKAQREYRYKDHGSLVSLSRFSTVGSLMGNLMRGSMMIEGRIARIVYLSLYRMHQVALHGYFKTGLMMLSGTLNRVIRPRLKMH